MKNLSKSFIAAAVLVTSSISFAADQNTQVQNPAEAYYENPYNTGPGYYNDPGYYGGPGYYNDFGNWGGNNNWMPWGRNRGWGNRGWGNGYYDYNDWPEWTPMYWMEEFIDEMDDEWNNDGYYGGNRGWW